MSDLPRLLFCCFDVVPAPTAVSRRLTEYLKGLSERFQVVVLSVKTPDHPHIERYHGARLLRVPVGSGDFMARVQAFDRAVRRQLESEEYLLVHFFDPFGGYALAERRGELGYKLVYDACAFPSLEMATTQPEVAADRRFVAKARRQELFCLMNADAVIVGNPLTRDWVSTMGVEPTQIHLLPAPVDLSLYTAEAVGTPDATTMRVLHLGSLSPHHGLGLGLEALAKVVKGEGGDPLDVHLTVVGPQQGEWRARLDERASALGVTDKVDFQPPVAHDDVHKVVATADVGLLALEDNERNRVVGAVISRLGEYLAAARPLLVADVPAARHLVPPEAAVWFTPGDAASLAQAMRALATEPTKRVALGQAGRAAAEKWDAMKIRADLIAVYTTVTGQTVQRVADEEFVADPNEPTQLGKSVLAAEAGEVTQLGARPFVPKDDSAPGTNKVIVSTKDDSSPGTGKVSTDPATDSQRVDERPPVMGVPLREDLPIIEGMELAPAPGPGVDGALPVPPPPWRAPLLDSLPEPVRGALGELDLDALPTGQFPRSSPPVERGSDEVLLPPPPPEETPVPPVERGSDMVVALPPPEETPLPPPVELAPPVVSDLNLEPMPDLAPPSAPLLGRPSPPAASATHAPISDLDLEPPEALAPEVEPESPAGPPRLRAPTFIEPLTMPEGLVALPPAPFVAPLRVPPFTSTATPAPAGVTSSSPSRPPVVPPPLPGSRPSRTGLEPEAERPVAKVSTPDGSPAVRPSSGPSRSAADAVTSPSGVRAAPPAPVAPARAGGSAGARSGPVDVTLLEPALAVRAAEGPSGEGARERQQGHGEGTRPEPAPSLAPGRATDATRLEPPYVPPAAFTSSGSSGSRLEPGRTEATRLEPPSVPPVPAAPFTSSGSSGSRPGTSAGFKVPAEALRPPSGSAPPFSSSGSRPPTRPENAPKPPPLPPPGAGFASSGSRPPSLPATHAVARPPAPAPSFRSGATPLPAESTQPVMAASLSSFSIEPLELPPISAPSLYIPDAPSRLPPPPMPPPMAPPPPPPDEVEEIGDDEVEALEADAPSGPAKFSEEDLISADSVQAVEIDHAAPLSGIDPWLAQVVHGYCPPGSNIFDRPVPPTTMPGRDT